MWPVPRFGRAWADRLKANDTVATSSNVPTATAANQYRFARTYLTVARIHESSGTPYARGSRACGTGSLRRLTATSCSMRAFSSAALVTGCVVEPTNAGRSNWRLAEDCPLPSVSVGLCLSSRSSFSRLSLGGLAVSAPALAALAAEGALAAMSNNRSMAFVEPAAVNGREGSGRPADSNLWPG